METGTGQSQETLRQASEKRWVREKRWAREERWAREMRQARGTELGLNHTPDQLGLNHTRDGRQARGDAVRGPFSCLV